MPVKLLELYWSVMQRRENGRGGAKHGGVKWILPSVAVFLYVSVLTNLNVISSLAVCPLRAVKVHSVPWNSAAKERPPSDRKVTSSVSAADWNVCPVKVSLSQTLNILSFHVTLQCLKYKSTALEVAPEASFLSGFSLFFCLKNDVNKSGTHGHVDTEPNPAYMGQSSHLVLLHQNTTTIGPTSVAALTCSFKSC